jgi:hypothetical protein
VEVSSDVGVGDGPPAMCFRQREVEVVEPEENGQRQDGEQDRIAKSAAG